MLKWVTILSVHSMEVTIVQVDHIDENTIRVRITKQELENRGVKILDLLGDKSKIQQFFYSILDEIDTDHKFADNTPVTFQVMPNNGGLDLLISKVAGMKPGTFPQLDGDKRKSFFDLDDNESDEEQKKEDDWSKQKRQMYRFDDLGIVVELADNLKVSDLAASLYYLKGKYYLDLAFLDEDYAELTPADAWAIANEYGTRIESSEIDYVKRTGSTIFRQDALGNLRQYFCKAN